MLHGAQPAFMRPPSVPHAQSAGLPAPLHPPPTPAPEPPPAPQTAGYECTFERRLRTGLFGCPQTRDRLIVLAALESLPLPSMPQPIHSDIMSKAYPEDETDVKMAFMTSTSAYPIGMWAGRKSNTELMRSLVIGVDSRARAAP